MAPRSRSEAHVGGFLVAVLATAGMVLLRWLLDPWMGDTLPLVTLYGAVAAAVWYGGYRPALVATALGFVACNYLFMEPRGSLTMRKPSDFIGLVLYLFTCFVIIGFGEAMRVSRRRFEELARRQDPLSPPTPADIDAVRRKYSLHGVTVIGFGLTLAVLAIGGVLGYVNVWHLAENDRKVAHSHAVIEELESLLSTLKDAETGQRGYLLAEDPKYLQPYDGALRRVEAVLANLNDLTSGNADQQARLAELGQKVAAMLDELKRTVALTKQRDRAAALQVVRSNEGKLLMDDVRITVATMRQAEEERLQRRAADSEAGLRSTVLSVALTGVIGVGLIGVVWYLSQRNWMLRQRAAEVLAEQREWLRVTLASIGDAVITTDTKGRITYLNATAEALTGWAPKDAVGQPLAAVFRVVNERSRQPIEDPVEKVLAEGRGLALANHTVLIAKNGTERPIDDSAAPIRDAAGVVRGVVLIFRDIAERRKAEMARQQLAAIVESCDDAIIGKNLSGIITNWNRGAERLYGYTAAEVIGKPICLLLPPDHADELPGILERLKRGEPIDRYDTVRVRNDGRRVDVSVSISPVRDEAGTVIGASAIAQDVSVRRRAEEVIRRLNAELQIRADELQTILDVLPVGIAIAHDPHCRHIAVNSYLSDLLGVPAGANASLSAPPGERPTGYANYRNGRELPPEELPMQMACSGVEVRGFETDLVRAGRDTRRLVCYSRPLLDNERRVRGSVGAFLDITELKRAEQALVEADRRKNEFVATLAHELRNPLGSIRNAAELLRLSDRDRALVEQARGVIERQLRGIVRLVDDLLDISRITQGKVYLRKERIELDAVVQSAVEAARPLIEAQGHALTVTLPPEAISLDADPTRLAQVFSNLLDNAAKYTEKGGQIWLSAGRQGDRAVVSVRDSGIGIRAEHLPLIFGLFSQVPAAAERSRGGLGIGLSLVKGLVELHGGTIEAHSAGPGQGSEFTVRLPVADPLQRPDGDGRPA